VAGQVDALQPDDRDEQQSAAGQRGQQAGQVARAERPDPEQVHVEHRFGYLGLHQPEQDQQGHPPARAAIIRELVQPIACPR
jgi:hypothetical protein